MSALVVLAFGVPASGLLVTACANGDGSPTTTPTADVAATVNGQPVHGTRVDAVMAEARLSGKEIGVPCTG
ncbi:MAG TPA: hypothetical protein VJ787_09885 [Thermoleophilia bacterium]|nr:hypothetical protein [Thermoleophilia bacterium]